VEEALRRLCEKYGKAKLTKEGLVDILVGDLKLQPPTSQQKKLKKTLVKIAFEAAFPGETLDLAESDSSPDLSEPPGADQENDEASDDNSENSSNSLNCNDEGGGSYYNDKEGTVGGVLEGVGRVSLENTGTTCCLNSLLQVLGSSEWLFSSLGSLFLKNIWSEEGNLEDFSLLIELVLLLIQLNLLQGPRCLSPRNFSRLLDAKRIMDDKDEFNEGDPCDPLELLLCLLEYIKQDVHGLQQCTGIPGMETLLELFSVRRLEQVGTNGQVNQIDEACLYAKLPLHGNCSLEEAIQNNLRASHAEVICWPAVLIVAIDRVAENGGGDINNSRVTFSEDLRLGPFYKLRGTICHSGQNSSTGHYTAILNVRHYLIGIRNVVMEVIFVKESMVCVVSCLVGYCSLFCRCLGISFVALRISGVKRAFFDCLEPRSKIQMIVPEHR
jgi:hypothetical protein